MGGVSFIRNSSTEHPENVDQQTEAQASTATHALQVHTHEPHDTHRIKCMTIAGCARHSSDAAGRVVGAGCGPGPRIECVF